MMKRARYEVMGGLGAVIELLKNLHAENMGCKSFVVAEVNVFSDNRVGNTKYARMRAMKKTRIEAFSG